MGFFSKLRKGLEKTKKSFIQNIETVVRGYAKIDDEMYEDLEAVMLTSDIGVETTDYLLGKIREGVKSKEIRDGNDVVPYLEKCVVELLEENAEPMPDRTGMTEVIFIVGVNGVGKTTTIGKLANYFVREKKSVTLAAADTFRAAAADQLTVWAERAKVRIVKHEEGSDPSAVVFDAVSSAKAKKTDVVIVDTAGRLHVKANLMAELQKMDRVVAREYPEAHFYKLLVLDATTGQNALSQARLFDETVDLDGIVLTKLDGTAKGGFVVSLCGELHIPVLFVGTGEKMEDLQPFDAEEFTEGIV